MKKIVKRVNYSDLKNKFSQFFIPPFILEQLLYSYLDKYFKGIEYKIDINRDGEIKIIRVSKEYLEYYKNLVKEVFASEDISNEKILNAILFKYRINIQRFITEIETYITDLIYNSSFTIYKLEDKSVFNEFYFWLFKIIPFYLGKEIYLISLDNNLFLLFLLLLKKGLIYTYNIKNFTNYISYVDKRFKKYLIKRFYKLINN